jgi:hypothetical protein
MTDEIHSSHLKFGLRPPDPTKPRLLFRDYFTGVVPPYPKPTDTAYPLTFPIWLNDTLGCCVASTLGAIVKIVSNFYGSAVQVSDAQILAWYRTQNTGADPAHPGVHDGGMDIPKFLSWLRRQTLPDGSKIIGFVEIDPRNVAEVDAAIAIFGVIWTACQITSANQQEWDAKQPFDYVVGSEVQGGHSIAMVGQGVTNNPGELRLVTWARERNATDRWLLHNVTNMYVVITDRMLGDKHFVAGMNLAAFAADFTTLTGDQFPAPIPSPSPNRVAKAVGTKPHRLYNGTTFKVESYSFALGRTFKVAPDSAKWWRVYGDAHLSLNGKLIKAGDPAWSITVE